jgi:hypothetical protein
MIVSFARARLFVVCSGQELAIHSQIEKYAQPCAMEQS